MMGSAFSAVFRRDMSMYWQGRGGALNPLLFFVMVVVLFPLGLDMRGADLSITFSGVVWMAVLLAVMFGAEGMFSDDYHDGSLQQMLISPTPVVVVIWARLLALWVAMVLPLLVLSPVVLLLYEVPSDLLPNLLIGLLLGTPVLVCISSLGASLTVGLGGSGLLMAVICLPLYVPVLIFGSGLLVSQQNHMDTTGPMLILAAMLFAAITLLPLAIGAALRIGLNE